MEWYQALALIAIMSLVIMQACNCFEQSASYLGRNMGAGARGALIDAIGSSLPELLVTLMFVASGKPELILAGVAVTAGSAIFNQVVIPAMSILVARDADGKPVKGFTLSRKVLVRDGVFLLALEGLLIWFLGHNTFTLLMAGTLLGGYIAYAAVVIAQSKLEGNDKADRYTYESLESKNWFMALINYDINYMFFKDRPFTTGRAWVVLGMAVAAVAVACHYLAVGIEEFAIAMSVPVYFSAVVLGAAATSVPDTILSMKSSRRGEGDDAISNAVGSNIFDVTVALGLPIAIYLLAKGGSLPLEQSQDLTMLRWFVLGTSTAVILGLFLRAKSVGRGFALFLLGLYALWIGYIVYSL